MNDIHKPEPGQINEGRRRLAKGSLAAPVVLATFASKHALAAPAYRCTISGQLSNNFSPAGHGSATDSCVFSLTPTSLSGSDGKWGSVVKSTQFSSYFGKTYYVSNSDNKLYRAIRSGGGTAATFEQVIKNALASTSSGEKERLDLARWCIVALINATNSATSATYPLNESKIKAMFSATFNGGTYTYGTDVILSRAEVVSYLRFLGGELTAPVINKS